MTLEWKLERLVPLQEGTVEHEFEPLPKEDDPNWEE